MQSFWFSKQSKINIIYNISVITITITMSIILANLASTQSPIALSFVCLCVCLCLSRCLSGRFNYEGLVPHKQYFAGTLLEMSSCASYVSRTHDVIDDVTRWQSRSKFEIDISPSMFELERRSKSQNVWNANGYLSDIFNFRYNFRGKKFFASSKWRPFLKFRNIKHSYNLTQNMKRSSQIMPKKVFFMMMTSSMTSQGAVEFGPIYSFINEIATFFMRTKNRAKISSLNFLCTSIMRLWLHLYE